MYFLRYVTRGGLYSIVNLLYIVRWVWRLENLQCYGRSSGSETRKRNLRNFPDGAQKLLGDELQLIQLGGMPRDAKPFKGVDGGVVEIALRYSSDAYRVVLALQIGSRIYVFARLSKRNRRKALKRR